MTFAPREARFICLQARSSHGGEPHAAVAELDLTAENGTVLPRDRWRVVYVDSEEVRAENDSAEGAIDGKPGTFWHSGWTGMTPQFPHAIVIDLGEILHFAGVKYLPRQEDKPGRIKAFKVYARSTPFGGLE